MRSIKALWHRDYVPHQFDVSASVLLNSGIEIYFLVTPRIFFMMLEGIVLRKISRLLFVPLFSGSVAIAGPMECLHNGELIGPLESVYLERGTVTCQDPVTKIVLKEVKFKNWAVSLEKIYKAGSLQVETQFNASEKNNRYHGWRNFYNDGLLMREELFNHGELLLERSYFANGHLKFAAATSPNDKTEKSRVEFDEDGNLTNIICSQAVIGPKHRSWCGLDGSESNVSVFSGGKPSKKLTFVSGKLKTYEQSHDEALAISATGPIQDARKEGRQDGGQNGLHNDFYTDGKKKFEKRYNLNGRLDGIQRFYEHGSDKQVIEDLYEAGSWKESRIFFSTGHTKLHFVWNKISGHRRSGTYESFYESGKLESKGECYNDDSKNWAVSFNAIPTFFKHGQTLTWDENGDLREKSYWKNGERDGTTDYYYGRAGIRRLIKSYYAKGLNSTEKEFIESNKSWRPVAEREFSASGAIKKSKKI